MNMNENKEIVAVDQDMVDFDKTRKLCDMLMATPHYQKMGEEGIFAIIENAKDLGVPVRKALNGGMYFVQGKVEMTARLMSSLIRAQGHSVTIDKNSNDKICIVHGKRKDSGDTCTATFTIEEAARAGLANRGPWKTFPSDMLFARAISRLGRRLFSDIIGNCYVEGEISLDPNIKGSTIEIPISPIAKQVTVSEAEDSPISDSEIAILNGFLDQLPEYREKVDQLLEGNNLKYYSEMKRATYDHIIRSAQKQLKEKK